MAERVVQTYCCRCKPTFHLYVVTCNIFVSWQSYLLTYLLTYISSTVGCANFGPDWPLLFKVHEIWSVDFRKIIKIIATRCQNL